MRLAIRPRILVPLTLTVLAAACVFVNEDEEMGESIDGPGPTATAVIVAKSGSSVEGFATFTQVAGGVLAEVVIQNAPPGLHGCHLHENGDCSSEDGTSAGGHWNPKDVDHGAPSGAVHHAGDLGNIWVNANGEGHLILLLPGRTVTKGPVSVKERAIIIHADADDLQTQPTGNAGARIGCGVIQ